VIYSANQCLC